MTEHGNPTMADPGQAAPLELISGSRRESSRLMKQTRSHNQEVHGERTTTQERDEHIINYTKKQEREGIE